VTYQANDAVSATPITPDENGKCTVPKSAIENKTGLTIVVTEKTMPKVISASGNVKILVNGETVDAAVKAVNTTVAYNATVSVSVPTGKAPTISGTKGTEYTSFVKTSTEGGWDIWTLTGVVSDVTITCAAG
jgi:hypothetical protein